MQCLYCETELKALRGLFDEDFCCKDHREKYFASFRKGITLLPVLDLPPLAPTQETTSQETAAADAEEPLEMVPQLERMVEVAEEQQEELPEPVVALAAEAPAEPLLISETTFEVAEEIAPVESSTQLVLAAAEELPEAEPVREIHPPVQEIAAEAPKPPAVEKPVAVAASIEAVFDDDDYEEAAVAPPAADFLHLHVVPFGAADCYFMIEEDSFSACNGPAIPDVEVFCDATFDPEERLAHLLAPAEMVAAGPVSGATGRAAAAAEPLAGVTPQLVASSFRAWDYATPSMPALEVAELIEHVEMFVAGDISPQMTQSRGSEPVALAPAPLVTPAFHASAEGAAHPCAAEAVELDLFCQQIESAPLIFSDMAPEPRLHTPAFQVSAVAMQLDEDLKRAVEPPKKEAVRLAEPEIARPAVMSAAPVSRAVSTATFHPPSPANSARPEAQLNVPAMSSQTDAVPSLASEVVSDPPRGAAAEQPPTAHSSDPVQPAIQNSARIKNWRLKITFAKPA